MTISKKPYRCEPEIEGRVIKQFMPFNYLGMKVTTDGRLIEEIQIQTKSSESSRMPEKNDYFEINICKWSVKFRQIPDWQKNKKHRIQKEKE